MLLDFASALLLLARQSLGVPVVQYRNGQNGFLNICPVRWLPSFPTPLFQYFLACYKRRSVSSSNYIGLWRPFCCFRAFHLFSLLQYLAIKLHIIFSVSSKVSTSVPMAIRWNNRLHAPQASACLAMCCIGNFLVKHASFCQFRLHLCNHLRSTYCVFSRFCHHSTRCRGQVSPCLWRRYCGCCPNPL